MDNEEIFQQKNQKEMDSQVLVRDYQMNNSDVLHTLVRVLTRHWRWIIGSIMICALFAAAATLLIKPTYQATATIELNKSSSSVDLGLGGIMSNDLSAGGDNLMVDQQTETAILEGDTLALAVIQRLGLASQSPFTVSGRETNIFSSEKGLPLDESPKTRTRLLRIFKAGLKINPVRGTRLIQVTYESHEPKQAALIANALIESYKNQYLQTHYDATSEASDWLTNQLSELKANVEDSEKKVTDFEKQNGILSINMMPTDSGSGYGDDGRIHSVVIQRLDALNAELTVAEANRIEKEAIYRLVQTGNDDVILGLGSDPLAVQSNSMVLTQGGGISNLIALRQQQNQLKINIAGASATYGANNRHLKDMQIQLQALNEQIHQELTGIVNRARADFQLAQRTEADIRQRLDQQQNVASNLNEKTVQFAVLSQEAFSRKKLYEDLYTKLQEANVAAGMKSTNITIADVARAQSVPVRPKRSMNVALGMLFGTFVGFAIAFTLDGLDRTVNDPLEVEKITGRPVIGVIPDFAESGTTYGTLLAHGARRLKQKYDAAGEDSQNGSTSIWMLDHSGSPAAEAFRALRTSIMLSRTTGRAKTIVVTSCIPGEGKTTVANNLGVAYALHNKKVLIIDADMRHPSRLEGKAGKSNEAGLSTVLADLSTIDEVIIHGVHLPTLDVMPAGPHPPLPSELLGSEAFSELLEQLCVRYDIVVLDTPPALLVTDAVSVSSKADATIWVTRIGAVTRPQLSHAIHLIDNNGLLVIGFVANGMKSTIDNYGYEAYPSYYGKENPHDS